MAYRTIVPAVGVLSLVLLGGCATVPAASRYAYYRVPCTTPGAVVAEPVVLDPANAAAVAPVRPTLPPVAEARVDAPLPAPSPATCVVAVNERGYGGGYYPGRRYYGSFGVGLGFGSFGHGHYYGGHGGGHFGGGHHGGGHH